MGDSVNKTNVSLALLAMPETPADNLSFVKNARQKFKKSIKSVYHTSNSFTRVGVDSLNILTRDIFIRMLMLYLKY
jgi:hypothetical protein